MSEAPVSLTVRITPALILNPSTRTDREHGYAYPCVRLGCMGEGTCLYCGEPVRASDDAA